MSKALIAIKKIYKFGSGHVSAVSTTLRYPITLDSLLVRINKLAKQYNLLVEPKVFDLVEGKAPARSAVEASPRKGKGGIYILLNKTTGLFYLGSALRYFPDAKRHKEGRLNDYFMQGRVQRSIDRNSSKVSYDLAKMIKTHGIEDFILIIIRSEGAQPLIDAASRTGD